MLRRLLVTFGFLLSVLLLPQGTAHSQTLELESAKAMAMGGAYRALVIDNSAIGLNPAGLVQLPKIDFEPGFYRTVDGREDDFSTSVADSSTGSVGYGLSFVYQSVSPAGRNLGGIQGYRGIFALAFPVIPSELYIGLSVKYFKTDFSDPGLRNQVGVTGTVGALYRPIQFLAVGATFDNLINGNDSQAPRSITGGVGVIPASWFMADVDVISDLATDSQEKTGWCLGAQLSPSKAVALRGGFYKVDLTGQQVWTAGIGFIAETGTIDIAVRIPDGGTQIAAWYVTMSFLKFGSVGSGT